MKLLSLLKKNKRLPMHMPGHKRNEKLFPYLRGFARYDITEISGFDNLHDATGVLKESMQKTAKNRGADRCFYLINGATCGILASICACVNKGDKVICARNSHKSVYNALELAGAVPYFIMPCVDLENGIFKEITPRQIKKALIENDDAKLIIITSPTYEGVVSDVAEICRLAHEKNIPVLVDASHGAHFGYGYGFLESAVRLGADIVIESLHKTMPSLTQTATMYINEGLVDCDKISKKLAVFESSSPSYILLSAIDACMAETEKNKDKIFGAWQKNLDYFYKGCKKLEHLKILDGKEFFGFDRSKIIVCAKNANSVSELLREKGIEAEMSMPEYLILMSGAGDTKKTFKRLLNALLKIDKDAEYKVTKRRKKTPILPILDRVYSPEEADGMDTEEIKLKDASGRISKEYIFAYPPGVPAIVPGEVFNDEIISYIAYCKKNGTSLKGISKSEKVLVIK